MNLLARKTLVPGQIYWIDAVTGMAVEAQECGCPPGDQHEDGCVRAILAPGGVRSPADSPSRRTEGVRAPEAGAET